MDGSTWNNYRFVSEQTKAPFLLETTSDDYYITQYKDLGYEVLASYFSQETYELTENWQKTRNRYQFFLEHGMTFDKFDLSVAKQEFQELATFCNAAFRKNFFFSPIKEEDFVEKMMQVIPILNPEYTIIARSEGAIAGFFFAYQDLHNKEEKSLVIKTLARDIDRPFGGLGAVLTSIGMEAAIRDGFTHCIHALMIDHNASAILSDKYNGRIRSRYELLYYTL